MTESIRDVNWARREIKDKERDIYRYEKYLSGIYEWPEDSVNTREDLEAEIELLRKHINLIKTEMLLRGDHEID